MGDEWRDLEGVEATERILHAALSAGAHEIHLSADGDGATLFFVSPENIEFFAHVACCCRDRIRNYLRTLAAIDSWKPAPVVGFGVFRHGGVDCQLEVAFLKGSSDQDVIIKITRD